MKWSSNNAVCADPTADTLLGFGGGCHWCTEAIFAAVEGVNSVEQGWIASHPPYERFSEAVRVKVDLNRVAIATLLEIHCATHSSRHHSMRNKYRSAVYVTSGAQKAQCEDWLASAQCHGQADALLVLELVSFKASPEYYQNYYIRQMDKPFSKRFIQPKLARLRARFGNRLQLPKERT